MAEPVSDKQKNRFNYGLCAAIGSLIAAIINHSEVGFFVMLATALILWEMRRR